MQRYVRCIYDWLQSVVTLRSHALYETRSQPKRFAWCAVCWQRVIQLCVKEQAADSTLVTKYVRQRSRWLRLLRTPASLHARCDCVDDQNTWFLSELSLFLVFRSWSKTIFFVGFHVYSKSICFGIKTIQCSSFGIQGNTLIMVVIGSWYGRFRLRHKTVMYMFW